MRSKFFVEYFSAGKLRVGSTIGSLVMNTIFTLILRDFLNTYGTLPIQSHSASHFGYFLALLPRSRSRPKKYEKTNQKVEVSQTKLPSFCRSFMCLGKEEQKWQNIDF